MRAITVIATILATLLALLGAVPASAERGSGPRWGECPDLGLSAPGLQCATLDLPLDYRNPRGATIQVAISRLESTNPARRRGVLLMNPGGPGGSGLGMPSFLATGAPELRESYDLIGFDPRGVNHSSPVSCGLPEEYITNIPPYARNAAEVNQQAVVARRIAELCRTGPSAAVLPHINTANTARDMDRIRAALGQSKISYLGESYGTYLGAVYATLFPGRTDRFVLDSVTGPNSLDVAGSRQLGLGFQQRFPDFATFAAANDATYHLGGTPRAVTAKFFELINRLDRAPVLGVDGVLFRLLTFSRLYFAVQLPELAEIWQFLDSPDAAAPTPSALADAGVENVVAAQLTVVCNDNDWPDSVRTYQRNVAVDRLRYPMFGAAGANIWPCAFWPDPIEPPVRINDRGPSTILLVQNTRDPATPLVGAREMRDVLGQRARMVTVDQGGHGVFLIAPNGCGNNAVSRFLTDGTRPTRDSFCPAESEVTAAVAADVSWLTSVPRI